MKKEATHKKLLFSLALLLLVNLAIASFTGSSTKNNDNSMNMKFSLKNLSKYSKNYSLSGLKLSQFQFKGTQDLMQQRTDNTITGQTMIRLEKGNTTYVYPYKYKVVLPRFKTPAPPFH